MLFQPCLAESTSLLPRTSRSGTMIPAPTGTPTSCCQVARPRSKGFETAGRRNSSSMDTKVFSPSGQKILSITWEDLSCLSTAHSCRHGARRDTTNRAPPSSREVLLDRPCQHFVPGCRFAALHLDVVPDVS